MKKVLLILLASGFSIFSGLNAQNILSNGGFETNTTIPCGLLGSSVALNNAATGWFYPTIGSSDLFSTTVGTGCSNFAPTCPIWGPQAPRTGDEMVGFYGYLPSGYREYVMHKLDTPTVIGETYCLEMFVSRGDFCQYDVSHIGMLLTTDSMYRATTGALNRFGTAEVLKPTPVTQDTGWEAITGTIVADSVYNYIIVGCLYDTSVMYTTTTDMAATRPYGYFYADDISVKKVTATTATTSKDTIVCLGTPVTLWADTSLGSAYNYVWNDGTVGTNITVTTPGAFYVDITDCGFAQRDSFNITADSIPTTKLGPDSSFCLGETYTVDATHPTAISYIWSDGSTNPIKTFNQSGTYSLTTIGECGSTSDDITIEVENCECLPQVPNAFTPNDDGLNDLFRPILLGCVNSTVSFTVMNRYGEVVYLHGADSQGWDGTFQGRKADNGVYLWHFQYLSNDGQYTQTEKGTVTLIR